MPKKGTKIHSVDATAALLAAQDYFPDEEEEKYEVEAIVDDKIVSGIPNYLVKWRGYGPEHNTWEPEENLVDCDLHLQSYRKGKRAEQTLKKAAVSSGQRLAAEKPAERTNSHRGKAKRLVPDQPDDQSSSSSLRTEDAGPSHLAKRQATATRLTAAAAAAMLAREESNDSEDLPLALGRTGRHGRGSRPSSRLRSASKLQSVKRDDNGSEEIQVSLPKKMAATPVCKTAKPTSSVKKPSQFDDSSDEEIAAKIIWKSPSIKKVSLLCSSDDEEILPPKFIAKTSAVKKGSAKTTAISKEEDDDEEDDDEEEEDDDDEDDDDEEEDEDDEEEEEDDEVPQPKAIPKASVPKPRSAVEVFTKGRPVAKRAAATPQASTSVVKKAATDELKKDEVKEDTREYEVERIIGAVFGQGGRHWALVFWKGFALVDCTWEPVANLGNAARKVQHFYKEHGKPSVKKRQIMTDEGKTFEKKHGKK